MSATILIGLPGSGKTTFAKRYDHYVDGDSFKTLDDLIAHCQTLTTAYVLDGLFLSKEVQQRLERELPVVTNFIYFEPNREYCVYNDAQRLLTDPSRKSSKNTILHAPIFKPEKKFLITKHVQKYDYVAYLFPNLEVDTTISSSTWTLEGSTYGTCWDENGPSEPTWYDEDAISLHNFYEYRKIIEHFYPNPEEALQHFAYLLEEDSDSEADYYGGVEYRGFYKFTPRTLIEAILTKLYEMTCFDMDHVTKYHPELLI